MKKMEYVGNKNYFIIDHEFYGRNSSEFDYTPTPSYTIPMDWWEKY